MKKRVIATLLGCMILTLTACSGGADVPKTEQEAQVIADGISRTADAVETFNEDEAWAELLVLTSSDSEEAKEQAKALRNEIENNEDWSFFEEKASEKMLADLKETSKACEAFDMKLIDMGLYDDACTIGYGGIKEQYPDEYAQLEALQAELGTQLLYYND